MKGRRRRGDDAPSDTAGRDPAIGKESAPHPSCLTARGGFFLGRGGTRRRPAGRDGHLFSDPGEPVGDPWDGAAASRQTSPHLNTPHIQHNAPHLNGAKHSPCLPSGRGSQPTKSPDAQDAPRKRGVPEAGDCAPRPDCGEARHGRRSSFGATGTAGPRPRQRLPCAPRFRACLRTGPGRTAGASVGRDRTPSNPGSRGRASLPLAPGGPRGTVCLHPVYNSR